MRRRPRPRERGIEREVVKLDEAENGFALIPRHWVVERSFALDGRFGRMSKDSEMLADTLASLHAPCFRTLLFKVLGLGLMGA